MSANSEGRFSLKQIVRKGRGNNFSIGVALDGEPFDFRHATGFELNLAGVRITSGITGNELGELVFNIQDENVPVGEHVAELIVFDALHPQGQVLVDRYSETVLLIKFI